MGIKLGPDPNRSYLERHNAMYPTRYGNLAPPKSAASASSCWRRSSGEAGPDRASGGSMSAGQGAYDGLFVALRVLVVLVATFVLSAFTTFQLYRFTKPEVMTAGSLYLYVSAFFGAGIVWFVCCWRLQRLMAWFVACSVVGVGVVSLAWVARSFLSVLGG